jgi:hypothetical protein
VGSERVWREKVVRRYRWWKSRGAKGKGTWHPGEWRTGVRQREVGGSGRCDKERREEEWRTPGRIGLASGLWGQMSG